MNDHQSSHFYFYRHAAESSTSASEITADATTGYIATETESATTLGCEYQR